MKPEIKQLWVEALKSGKYKQGVGRLFSGDGFCCLGVLCNIYREKTGDGEWVHRGNCGYYFNGHNGYLPDAVQLWAGCEDSPVLGGSPAAALNDSGRSFTEIADLIQQHL